MDYLSVILGNKVIGYETAKYGSEETAFKDREKPKMPSDRRGCV
jgi:hypothetical protein